MSDGSSSCSWVVSKFLEPVANWHISTNKEAIDNINNDISNSVNCESCSDSFNPKSTSVKDFPIQCNKCGKSFHKKCSDRRKHKGVNWCKQPWFCQACILHLPENQNHSQHSLQGLSVSQDASSNTAPLQDTIRSTPLPSLPNHDQPSTDFSPSDNQTQQNQHISVKFPNNSTRQRSSNVNLNNAEMEFQKTALDAMRSNIVQQEVEIRRLNECLDIRNKRIMQLEDQVGHAADYMASRDSHHSKDNPKSDIDEKLAELTAKVNAFLSSSVSPTNNIYINSNSCKTVDYNNKSQQTQVSFPCDQCSKYSNNMSGNSMPAFENLCDECGKAFMSANDLVHHVESEHKNPNISHEAGATQTSSSQEPSSSSSSNTPPL